MFADALATIEDEEQRNKLAEFYSKHKQRLYSIAFSKLHNEEDAEDAVQEVFSEIADKPEKFFDIAPEGRLAYTTVMVKNISVKMFNAKNKIPIEELNEDIEDVDFSLEEGMLNQLSEDELLSFVNQLPTLQKNVLILHCLLDLSIDKTAQRLNISLIAAKKRLVLARKAIKAFIDERNKNYE